LWQIVLQNSFWITEDKFSRLWARRSNNRAGTTATNDELTDNFGSAPEDTSIGDYRLVALFAEKSLKAVFGVLQHYRHLADVAALANDRFAPEPHLPSLAHLSRLGHQMAPTLRPTDLNR
jgi:hypothetical protein